MKRLPMAEHEKFKELTKLRKQQRELRKKIDELREELRAQEYDPDYIYPDQTERNRKISGMYFRGTSYTDIGKEFNLNSTTIRNICVRAENKRNKRKSK